MPHLVFLHSLVAVHATFIVRQIGATASQLVYILPPPPTVVGSFMNPLARILDLGEEGNVRKYGPAGSRAMSCALRATLAAAAGLKPSGVGVAVHAELSRVLGAPYKSGGSYQRALRKPPYEAVAELLPVQAVGYASAPSLHLHLAWLIDAEKLSECLGVQVSVKELRKVAWSVYRVGSREGIVSVVEAEAYDSERINFLGEGLRFESLLYQPEECVTPLEPLPRVMLYNKTYREALYYTVADLQGGPEALPPPAEPALFEVKSGCKAAHPRGEHYLTVSYTVGGGGS